MADLDLILATDRTGIHTGIQTGIQTDTQTGIQTSTELAHEHGKGDQ